MVGLGLGYSLAKYLASKEHDVIGIDIDEKAWKSPRIDDEMKDWLAENDRPVYFSSSFDALKDQELIMIFVSTPLSDLKTLSIANVVSALERATEAAPNAEFVVLSTLPIGAMHELRIWFRGTKISYAPPMIKKHKFLSTFISPPSGWQMFSVQSSQALRGLFASLQPGVRQIVKGDLVVETAKLCTNMMLATKIIMANAVRDWMGGEEEARQVCEIVGSDPRVGQGYFIPDGPAAGPCLPRDMLELQSVATGPLAGILRKLNEANETERLV